LSKTEIDERLAALGFDPTCRAEELPYAELLRLCEAFPDNSGR
jgi:hypothetical protein